MSDTGTYHRCRRCQAISTGPCCSKCKAPHVHSCDKGYVPWRMSFDNRALGTNIVECVRIDPNTGLPFAVVPGGGLGFPGDGSYPGFTNIPTDTDPPSEEIPEPPTTLDPDPDPDSPPGGIGDRSLVSLPSSCGGDPVSFDFTVYGGVGMPYLTVNWDAGGQAMPGAMVITDSLGNVIAPCDVLTPPAGGQVLTATFTPDAGCELVGFTGTQAPSGNYNGQVVSNQYKASPVDCPNTKPDATATKKVDIAWDIPPVYVWGLYPDWALIIPATGPTYDFFLMIGNTSNSNGWASFNPTEILSTSNLCCYPNPTINPSCDCNIYFSSSYAIPVQNAQIVRACLARISDVGVIDNVVQEFSPSGYAASGILGPIPKATNFGSAFWDTVLIFQLRMDVSGIPVSHIPLQIGFSVAGVLRCFTDQTGSSLSPGGFVEPYQIGTQIDFYRDA